MIRLTLRTLLAYLDDTLPPADAKVIGQKLAENEEARGLAERIRVLVRKRSLSTPTTGAEGSHTDPNVVAAYLSDRLTPEMVEKFESLSLESDVSLAELAACHQILTLLLSDQVRVPPSAYKRMYGLVKGKESVPGRAPGRQAVPVGGVIPADKPLEADEADAAYLLGLPAYSKDEPFGRKMLRWGVAGLLACGFLVAAALAWFTLPTRPTGTAVAAHTENKETPTPTTSKGEESRPTDTKPTESKKEDPPKVDPKPEDPMKVDPKPEDPKKEDLGGKQPPNENRGAIAVSETGDEQVLVVKKTDADEWARVKKGAELQSTDRLVCLPGYRAKVLLKNGVAVELWGNVPGELLPLPFAETALTAHLPAEKIDADLTLHAGRVYLTSTLDRPAVVRLRVRDSKYPAKDLQFDITLEDKGCELVAEVQHALTPGAANEPARTVTVIHTVKGKAGLPLKGKPTPLAAGEVVVFDSVKGVPDGPQKPDEKARGLAYFDREPVYENPDKSRAMLKALRTIADRMKDAKSIPGAVAEQRTDPTAPPPDLQQFLAGAVWSVFATAALGDVAELADLLNDPNRQPIRTVAFGALRGLLASSPDKQDAFRTIARERWKLSADDADAFLNTVAGVAEQKRTDPEVLNKLADQLTAETVAQREAAMFVLLTEIDPAAQKVPVLAIDVAGPGDRRAQAVVAWKKRIAELTKEKK
jgi:hypothetical protein